MEQDNDISRLRHHKKRRREVSLAATGIDFNRILLSA
jgi:hypothetical protein